MRAEMNSAGVIALTPETGAEAFALKQWALKNFVPMDDLARDETGKWRQGAIVVVTSFEAEKGGA